MKENIEIIDEEEKNPESDSKEKDITKSTLALNPEDDKEKETEINKEKEIKKDKEKITVADLTQILGINNLETINEEKETEINIQDQEKTTRDLSNDEILNKELEKIKKKNLSKYLMEDNQFKSAESDMEFDINNKNNKKFLIKPKRCQLYKYVGRTLFIFLDRYENPLFIIGPHFGMYLCFCGIVTILMSVLYFSSWNKLSFLIRILGHISFWTFFISYTHCSLINPGYPKNDLGRKLGYPRGEYYLCTLCNFYLKKSNYAHHCLDCDICIENYDHHCPWTGHCIGKNNYYSFYIFTISSFVVIIYIFIAGSIAISKTGRK